MDGTKRLTIGQAGDFPPCLARAHVLTHRGQQGRPHSFGRLMIASVSALTRRLSDCFNLENDNVDDLPRSAKSGLSQRTDHCQKKHPTRSRETTSVRLARSVSDDCALFLPSFLLASIVPNPTGAIPLTSHTPRFQLSPVNLPLSTSSLVTLQHSHHFVLTLSQMQPAVDCHSR
jgi:hypothetical protein